MLLITTTTFAVNNGYLTTDSEGFYLFIYLFIFIFIYFFLYFKQPHSLRMILQMVNCCVVTGDVKVCFAVVVGNFDFHVRKKKRRQTPVPSSQLLDPPPNLLKAVHSVRESSKKVYQLDLLQSRVGQNISKMCLLHVYDIQWSP